MSMGVLGDFPESSNHIANETEVNFFFSLCSGECIGMSPRDSWSRHLVFLHFGADFFYTMATFPLQEHVPRTAIYRNFGAKRIPCSRVGTSVELSFTLGPSKSRRGALAELLTRSQTLFSLYLPRHWQLPVYLPPTASPGNMVAP